MKVHGRARRVGKLVLWAALLPAALVFVLRAFVGDVYYVDSHSMEPTLHGDPVHGEWVFVLFQSDPHPRRFDLVVATRPGVEEPVVKRVAGLPGDSVQVAGGDLYVESRDDAERHIHLLAPDQPRPPLVPIFDDASQDFATAFALDEPNRFVRTVSGRRIDAAGAKNVEARLKRLFDDYFAPDGTRVEGRNHANDAEVSFEVVFERAWKRFAVRLTEAGDIFVAELLPAPEGKARARLLRIATLRGSKLGAPEVLAELDVPFELGRAYPLRFSNVDNVLALELGSQVRFRHVYPENTAIPQVFSGGYTHLLPRMEIGGDDFVVELRHLRIARDLVYTGLGERFGVAQPEALGPDELFLLGDNSGESNDSREWGPVALSQVVGRPVAVVWPPARWRWLPRPKPR